MPTPTDYLKNGALRVIEPAISLLARNNVSPNAITTVGTLVTVAAGVVYATGHIMTAGWIMAVTSFFDVIDGEVARRTGRCTVFGAFYDSSLDRVADGALMAGLTVFYATNPIHTASTLWWSACSALSARSWSPTPGRARNRWASTPRSG